MGMAASQARFLNLTARKTNIEYQGQQINQQRTELSNESANLYNQMLTLQVPVPPNTQDYTKVEYSFTIPGSFDTQATVAQFAKTSTPGEYTVIFNYTKTEIGFPACSTSQRSDVQGTTADSHYMKADDGTVYQVQDDGGTFKYSTDGLTWIALDKITTEPTTEPAKSAWTQLGDGSTLYSISGSNIYFDTSVISGITTATPVTSYSDGGPNYEGSTIKTYKGKTTTLEYVDPSGAHKDAYDYLSENGTNPVYVTNVGTEEKPVYQYYTQKDIEAAKLLGADGHCVYYTASDIDVYKEDSYTPVTISRDGNNRVQSFNYKGEDYAVKANTITDDAGYEDAMNEYTYQSYLYEQAMNNINAKTSIVQAQDRELELKLKQLDTEHNAVQTEIDAVKAVCKKNVEDSFKTFA